MRFKVDENLHDDIAELLRQGGHDALTVLDQGLRGRDDREIANVCRTEKRVLISLDLDFANILDFPPAQYPGLIVLRLHARGRTAVRAVVTRILPHLAAESLVGRLWIVDEHSIRVHDPAVQH